MSGRIKAVIFDLDGVVVCTDEYHYQAWKRVAQEEGISFCRETNERLRGISRMESLEIVLEKSKRVYTDEKKIEIAGRKNAYYQEMLKNLSPKDILPGVKEVVHELKRRSIKIGIGSSSKNASQILKMIRMANEFDAISDGNSIKKSKPDPEVFLLAAKLLGEEPKSCVVIEDAYSGIDAAIAAGMKAVGIGFASSYNKADYSAEDVAHLDINELWCLR